MTLGMIFRDDYEMLGQLLPLYRAAFQHVIVIDYSKNQNLDFWAAANIAAYPDEWPGSYAAARNDLLDIAHHRRMPWLLMLDADEAVWPADVASMERFAAAQDGDALYFPRVNFTNWRGEWLPQQYPDYQTRLIRVGSDVRYVNDVHECSAGSKPRQRAPYNIFHYGLCKPPAETYAKWQRYAGVTNPPPMPPGFAEYKELGQRALYPHPHPAQLNIL